MDLNNSSVDSFANRLAIAMQNKGINQIELAEKTKQYKYISQSLINFGITHFYFINESLL